MSTRPILSIAAAAGAALGANLVPVAGFFGWSWPTETVMLLYLVETLLVIPLVALRVRLQAPSIGSDASGQLRRRDDLLAAFLAVGLGFTVASGVFILFFFFGLWNVDLDYTAFWAGMQGILFFVAVGQVAEIGYARAQTLAGAEKLMERSLSRVAVLYFAVFVGLFLAFFGRAWFLIPFIVLKTLADLDWAVKAFTGWRGADSTESTGILTSVHSEGKRKSR